MIQTNTGSPVSRCGRCGKKLTAPLSIARGIGPVCWGKMMIRPLMRMTEIFDMGALTNSDRFPPLNYYLKQIVKWECSCKADLHKGIIHHFKYELGYPLKGYHKKQWIGIICGICGLVHPLWQLGVLVPT